MGDGWGDAILLHQWASAQTTAGFLVSRCMQPCAMRRHLVVSLDLLCVGHLQHCPLHEGGKHDRWCEACSANDGGKHPAQTMVGSMQHSCCVPGIDVDVCHGWTGSAPPWSRCVACRDWQRTSMESFAEARCCAAPSIFGCRASVFACKHTHHSTRTHLYKSVRCLVVGFHLLEGCHSLLVVALQLVHCNLAHPFLLFLPSAGRLSSQLAEQASAYITHVMHVTAHASAQNNSAQATSSTALSASCTSFCASSACNTSVLGLGTCDDCCANLLLQCLGCFDLPTHRVSLHAPVPRQ